LAALAHDPAGDRAAGMLADGRERDDAVGRMRARVRVEAAGIEPEQQHLVEPRAVAHDLADRVHRPDLERLGVEPNVTRLDRLAGLLAFGLDEAVAGLGSLVGARLVVIGLSDAAQTEAHAGGDGRLEKTPPRRRTGDRR